MNVKKYSIGIIGHTGTVGSELYSYFKKRHYSTYGFSKIRDANLLASKFDLINQAKIVFICVPTPYDYEKNTYDFSIVEEVIRNIKPNRIVVIKSTILPGITDSLQKKYPDLFMLFNPEFLSRLTARSDFLHPDRQIIGYTNKSKKIAQDILHILPKGNFSAIVKSSEAELIKYSHNMFGALSVTYANFLYDVCKSIGVRYEVVIRGFHASKYLKGINRYTTIYHNKKRGYGGLCFPKDINSFLVYCKAIGVRSELINAVRKANKRVLASQGMTEKEAEAF